LQVGADKVAVNTAAVEDPELIDQIARRFGSQSVIVSIDVRRRDDMVPEVWTHSGAVATGRSPVQLAQEAEARGAGEILLASIDRDGTMRGYDLIITEAVSAAVGIPVIASGGAGVYADMDGALRAGASAVAAASMFHFTQQTPLEAKRYLASCGHLVRL
jgi:cyclase